MSMRRGAPLPKGFASSVCWLVGCGVALLASADAAAQDRGGNSRTGEPPAAAPADSRSTPVRRTVLTEDFEGEPKGDWSLWQTDRTPADGKGFLGQFGAQAVTLAIDQLPPHKLLRVNFDLYVIRTWDGSQTVFGPDIWQLSLVNGPALVRTTFNNCQRVGSDQQAYPDDFPCPPHRCWTGAAARESLGYTYQFKTRGTLPMDAVYRIEAVVPHRGAVAGLQLAAFYNDKGLENQSWGIDNLEVQTIDAFETLSDAELQQHWKLLAGDDPVLAVGSMWRLAAAGDGATRWVANQIRADQEQIEREVAEGTKLLETVMKVDARERPSVMKLVGEKLALLSSGAISALQQRHAEAEDHPLTKTLRRASGMQGARPGAAEKERADMWRLRRLKRLLGIIDTPAARRALWTLSEPGKYETKDEPYLETQLKCD
jgi:hypothetical protein